MKGERRGEKKEKHCGESDVEFRGKRRSRGSLAEVCFRSPLIGRWLSYVPGLPPGLSKGYFLKLKSMCLYSIAQILLIEKTEVF